MDLPRATQFDPPGSRCRPSLIFSWERIWHPAHPALKDHGAYPAVVVEKAPPDASHGGQPAGRSAAASASGPKFRACSSITRRLRSRTHAAAVALPVTGSSRRMKGKADIDLVVVGAGAGGMVAALVAALEGLRVVLCEGSQQVGGTTATSAGTLWIPGNRHGAEGPCRLGPGGGQLPGRADRAGRWAPAAAGVPGIRRRGHCLPRGAHRRRLRQCGTASGLPGFARCGDRWPGAGAAPFDGRLLRGAFARIRPPMPEFLLLGGMMVGKADIQALVRRWQSWPAFVASAGWWPATLSTASAIPRHAPGDGQCAGRPPVLQPAARRRRRSLRLAPAELTVEGGKVRGATFAVDGQERRLDSRAGVVLATGGVGHGEAPRAELVPAGMSLPCWLAMRQRRRHHRGAIRRRRVRALRRRRLLLAADVARATPRWAAFSPIFPGPRQAGPGCRGTPPGTQVRRRRGSYHHFVEAMVRHLQRTGGDAAWLVCDAAFVHKYGLGVILLGTRRLDRWIRQGYVCVADRLPALAQRAGIDPAGLLATVQRTNDYAATGRDPTSTRAMRRVDRFNGDRPTDRTLAHRRIGQPPFVALRIPPADAASSSGLPIDADGRVLDRAGRVVVGLYAPRQRCRVRDGGTYPPGKRHWGRPSSLPRGPRCLRRVVLHRRVRIRSRRNRDEPNASPRRGAALRDLRVVEFAGIGPGPLRLHAAVGHGRRRGDDRPPGGTRQ